MKFFSFQLRDENDQFVPLLCSPQSETHMSASWQQNLKV